MAHLVLVVDDDPTVLDVLAEMLKDLGCEVISANGGCDALKKLSDNDRISILITDINMPAMDGHELAERARRIKPELKILQLSGREPRRDGYPMIRKPFSAEDWPARCNERPAYADQEKNDAMTDAVNALGTLLLKSGQRCAQDAPMALNVRVALVDRQPSK